MMTVVEMIMMVILAVLLIKFEGIVTVEETNDDLDPGIKLFPLHSIIEK